jgi:archaellum component FlaC
MKGYHELKALLEAAHADFEKFYEKENNAAGTRVRKHLAEIKKKAQEIRNEVQDIKTKRKGDA